MSGIVDMWTSELAKLRNKGEAEAVSSAKPGHQREASPLSDADDRERRSTLWDTSSLAKAVQVKLQHALQFSEASVSMLVESFCP
ncbi:Hypothetical predicted protein [Olea europaea subsp. europaea]|uniref:Uncharacterized protein n=1 Tax=Olea europaea subsp. europaea TaxID=158383 RepID=A0A8S0PG47_OLEEU|nr:Hypothetical predicted protein [Olea europaea subsp. europaea]